MSDSLRSEMIDNLHPIEAKLEDWEPDADELDFYGSKVAAWLAEMDFEAIEFEDSKEAENFSWSVGYFCGMARALNVTTLVICGFSFTTGMRATIYEASARDFRIVLVSDALCGASESSLSELARIGIFFVSSDTCASWMSGSKPDPVAA